MPTGMQSAQLWACIQNCGPDQDSRGGPGAPFAPLTLPDPHAWRRLLTRHEDGRVGTLCV